MSFNSNHPIFQGSTFGMITADNPHVQPSNPDGYNALKAKLGQMGLKYEEMDGFYDAPEKSFLVHNPTRQQMISLGKEFGQESVIHSTNKNHELIYTNGNKVGTVVRGTGHEPLDGPQKNAWSHLPGVGHFRLNLDFDHPQRDEMSKNEYQPHEIAQELAKSIQKKINEYSDDLLKLRQRELKKAQEEESSGEESSGEESSGEESSGEESSSSDMCPMCGQLDKPETCICLSKQQLNPGQLPAEPKPMPVPAQKSDIDMTKTAPPGFSEETMHKLKAKHGTESAFKIAWAAHEKGKKAEKSEDFINLAGDADTKTRTKAIHGHQGKIPSDAKSKEVKGGDGSGEISKEVKKEEPQMKAPAHMDTSYQSKLPAAPAQSKLPKKPEVKKEEPPMAKPPSGKAPHTPVAPPSGVPQNKPAPQMAKAALPMARPRSSLEAGAEAAHASRGLGAAPAPMMAKPPSAFQNIAPDPKMAPSGLELDVPKAAGSKFGPMSPAARSPILSPKGMAGAMGFGKSEEGLGSCVLCGNPEHPGKCG